MHQYFGNAQIKSNFLRAVMILIPSFTVIYGMLKATLIRPSLLFFFWARLFELLFCLPIFIPEYINSPKTTGIPIGVIAKGLLKTRLGSQVGSFLLVFTIVV